ncbi:hypothetical protein D3C81_361550 [compost metagenome]
MRQIDDHLALFHGAQPLPAQRRQAAFFQAMLGAGQFRVEEMRGRGHAEAGLVQGVEVVQLAFERMRAFQCQPAGHQGRVLLARGDEAAQLCAAADDAQLAMALARLLAQLVGLVSGARQQAVPGGRRQALRHHQGRDVVRVAAIALDIHLARRLGDDGKSLQGHVAPLHAGKVDMAALAVAVQVALPQQAVRVQVGDPQVAVQGQSGRRWRLAGWRMDAVEMLVDEDGGGQQAANQRKAGGGDGTDDHCSPFHHGS